ncbi:zinc-binding metallopeptidase family protein, partial [Burkholderia cenocepacia]|uniref:hypothetical protein n=1 Tax=Burkholderia cenocepacia TaxID=95486 RepID=UPI002ABD595D
MNYSMKEQYGLGGICKALPVLAAGLLVSCVGGGDVTENPPSGRAGMPSNQEIFGYIKDITDFGPRRTGSEASVKASDYVAGSFKEFGLQRVTIETGDTYQWEARKWGLEVAGVTIPSFYMRHSFHPGKVAEFSTGPDGLNAQFVYVGNRKDLQGIDVQGKIVVADVELTEKSMGTYMTASTSVYDPNSTIAANEKRIDPFTPNNYPFNFASAMEGGAVGFIGILVNYFDSNKFYNEDLHYYINDDTVLSLPGLWVSRRDGETLKTILAQNPGTTGKLVLDGDVRKVQYRTVIGHLPGQSDETLMVQSHHDSGFMGAVEDASGVS